MTARLTWHYGIDPLRILSELPMGLVRALSKMVPILQAETAVQNVDWVAVGINAGFAEGHSKAAARRWTEVLPAAARSVARATPQQLASLGIGFRRVPKVSHAG